MLKRIAICILVTVAILAVGCKESGDSSGGSWNLVYEAPDDVYYSALCFPDEDNGWVIGNSGRILHTSDGGTTWETQDSGTTSDLKCVHFANRLVGWIGGSDNRIGRTTDGGASWTWEQPAGETRRTYMAMSFVDQHTGWIVDNFGGILHTEDGAATWVQQETGTDRCILSVQFLDRDEGWAISIENKILRTQDGGNTWTMTKIDISLQPAVGLSAGICFVDSDNGWIATDISASSDSAAFEGGVPLLHTTDGGKTWQVQASFPQEGRLSRVRFADHDTGWVVGSHNIFCTQDGGDSWSSQSISGGLFEDISFAHPLHPWVLSFEGKVYRYETD